MLKTGKDAEACWGFFHAASSACFSFHYKEGEVGSKQAIRRGPYFLPRAGII
jgi:hypothetical protein